MNVKNICIYEKIVDIKYIDYNDKYIYHIFER